LEEKVILLLVIYLFIGAIFMGIAMSDTKSTAGWQEVAACAVLGLFWPVYFGALIARSLK
jgi:hypothetical protein